MFLFVFILFLVFQTCSSVINNLDDIVYNRMPPLFALDEYNTCVKLGGTYCVARFELFAEPSNDLIEIITEYSEHYQRHYNHTLIDRGICLTRTCYDYIKDKEKQNKEELNDVVTACVNNTIWRDYGLQTKLSSLFSCEQSTDTIVPDLYDWTVMLIFVAILLANTVGTSYDILLRLKKNYNHAGHRFLLNLSIIKNLEKLRNPQCNFEGLQYLEGFNGVKVLTSASVVLAHTTYILFSSGFIDNPHDFENAYDSTHYHIIITGLAVIHIFFVISGFLLACKLQKKEETHSLTWSQLPKILLHRWIRLSAPYAIALLFSATWLRHLGSGPLWISQVTKGITTNCRKYWWLHLLYLHNYNSNDKLCDLASWQLAADTQLYVVGVFVFIATSSRNRGLVLIMLSVLGLVVPAMHIWMQKMEPIAMIYPEFFRSNPHDTFWLMHNRGHNNLTCYAIGMATGYLIYKRQKIGKAFTDYKVARLLVRLSIVGVIPIVLVILSSNHKFFEGMRFSIGVELAYAAGQRFLLGVIVAVTVISVANLAIVSAKKKPSMADKSGRYSSYFGWRGWVIPAQLSYCVSLLHMSVLYIVIGSRTQLEHFSFLNLMINFVGVLFLTYLMALPLYLLVEAPTKQFLKYDTTERECNVKKIN